MDSILNTIKAMLGIQEEYTPFDSELIVYINSAMLSANQIGVGVDGFAITGNEETWDDFFGGKQVLECVKQYIYMKVRLAFDPPANSFVVNSIEKQLDEMTWRINVQAEAVN